MDCRIKDLGLIDYEQCYGIQRQFLEDIKRNSESDCILLAEHFPVITIGRSGSRRNLLASDEFLAKKDIKVYEVDRGGDITFHGPGQLMAYPIIDLKRHYRDAHKFLRSLEAIVIKLLEEYKIESFAIKGKTGVWTNTSSTHKGEQDAEKICSIGIGISGWVSFHGLALNIDCDLDYFNFINPCGFKGLKNTSMSKVLGKEIDKENLKQRLISIFCKAFDYGAVYDEKFTILA